MTIPKKIHYCWFGEAEYPDIVKKCIQSWHDRLTGWELILWNEENSPINDSHPYLLKAIKEKKYAFASDYMRCLALYQFGGVYLDTDMEIIKSFEELLDNSAFIAPEDVDENVLNVAVLGCVKGHDLPLKIMSYYNNSNEFESIPDVAVKVISQNKFNLTKLSRSSFYPFNPYDPKQKVKQLLYSDLKENTFGIHHWYASWKPSLKARVKKLIKIFLLRGKGY